VHSAEMILTNCRKLADRTANGASHELLNIFRVNVSWSAFCNRYTGSRSFPGCDASRSSSGVDLGLAMEDPSLVSARLVIRNVASPRLVRPPCWAPRGARVC